MSSRAWTLTKKARCTSRARRPAITIVNSYTVYQNIELILWINGIPENEIRQRVPKIIERVGLTEFAKTKVSKLSGGQKQRVSIARALAKDTAVIVADEPTGNLDSHSAGEIVSLLAELSKDKLVVVVTHNFDQFAEHATRIVRLNDGRLIEDKMLVPPANSKGLYESECGRIKAANKLKLGFRNAFNIIPKFLLLLLVFFFTTVSVAAIYTNYKESESASDLLGYNAFFMNYSDDRIVVKNNDNSQIRESQLQKIENTDNVKLIVKDDELLDRSAYIEDDYLSFYGYTYPANAFTEKPSYGEAPKGGIDALICVTKEDGAIMGDESDVIGSTCSLMSEDGETELATVRICGIKYIESDNDEYMGESKIYLSEQAMGNLRASAFCQYSSVKLKAGEKTLSSTQDYDSHRLITTEKVKPGRS